jgi:hypothetical protein
MEFVYFFFNEEEFLQYAYLTKVKMPIRRRETHPPVEEDAT